MFARFPFLRHPSPELLELAKKLRTPSFTAPPVKRPTATVDEMLTLLKLSKVCPPQSVKLSFSTLFPTTVLPKVTLLCGRPSIEKSSFEFLTRNLTRRVRTELSKAGLSLPEHLPVRIMQRITARINSSLMMLVKSRSSYRAEHAARKAAKRSKRQARPRSPVAEQESSPQELIPSTYEVSPPTDFHELRVLRDKRHRWNALKALFPLCAVSLHGFGSTRLVWPYRIDDLVVSRVPADLRPSFHHAHRFLLQEIGEPAVQQGFDINALEALNSAYSAITDIGLVW